MQEDLKTFLFNAGCKELVDMNQYGLHFGSDLKRGYHDTDKPSASKGKHVLGKLLKEIRSQLQ